MITQPVTPPILPGAPKIRRHSIFGGSQRKRNRACPGSARLAAQVCERPDLFEQQGVTPQIAVKRLIAGTLRFKEILNPAAEGTLGHAIAELEIREWLDSRASGIQRRHTLIDVLRGVRHLQEIVSKDLLDAVEACVNYVKDLVKLDPHAQVWLERSFHYKNVGEDVWGSADCIVYLPSLKQVHGIDFKLGKGVRIEALNNEQLRMYGVGIINDPEIPKTDEYWLTILQPRIEPSEPRSEVLTYADLVEEEAKILAEYKASHDPEAPLVPGEHCRFCPGASLPCPAQMSTAMTVAQGEFRPVKQVLEPIPVNERAVRLGELLNLADNLDAWIHNLREYAYQEAEAGRVPTGYKLVEKRGSRKWKETVTPELLSMLLGFEEEVIYEPREMRSAPAFEKAAKLHLKSADPALIAAFNDLIEVKSSGLRLVSENEPGEPVAKNLLAAEFSVLT